MTCGKGMRTRQRMLKSAAELGDCNEELEQAEKCMLPECRECGARRLPGRAAGRAAAAGQRATVIFGIVLGAYNSSFFLREVIIWTIISCLPLVMKCNLKILDNCPLILGLLHSLLSDSVLERDHNW